MSARETFYGPAAVAEALGVTRPMVTNWHRRGLDVPPPDHVTVDGRKFWTDLAPWHAWHVAHELDRAATARRRATDAAARAARAADAAARAADAAARAAEHAAELDARAQVAQLAARRAGLDTDR